jgi:hypothetical protein
MASADVDASLTSSERALFRLHAVREFARGYSRSSLAGVVTCAMLTVSCLLHTESWALPASVTGTVLTVAHLVALWLRKRWLAHPEIAPLFSIGMGMVGAAGLGVSTGVGEGFGSWGGCALSLIWLYSAVSIGLGPRLLALAIVTDSVAFSIPVAMLHAVGGLMPFIVTLLVGALCTLGTASLRESMELRHFVATARWKRTAGAIESTNRQLEAVNHELETTVDAQLRTVIERRRDVQRLHRMIHSPDGERAEEIAVALERSLVSDDSARYAAGTVLGGRARILRWIGGGGFGDVYLAEDLASRERVAVKVLRPSKQATRGQLKRFFLEAAAAAAVNHRAIVRALHVDVDARGAPYIISEHITGCSLRRIVEQGPVNAGDAVALASVLVDALSAVHAAGLVHRDIKPDNVLLSTARPGVKLLDFGVSQWLGENFEITNAGELIGSVGYMPPERFEKSADARASGAAADVFAVGMLLFEIIAGQHPFGELGTLALVTRMSRADFPALVDVMPGIPRELSDFVAALLTRDPQSRPDIGAVAAGLAVLRAMLPAAAPEQIAARLLVQAGGDVEGKAARSEMRTDDEPLSATA